MASSVHRIGVLLSTTGSYGRVGRSMQNGLQLAASEIAATTELQLQFECADPAGDNIRYCLEAERMLRSGIRHIIGCYTSSSRKELLPLFERYGAVLWYPAHYEGFESSDNVVYTGTAPNHHMYPLVEFMLGNAGTTAYCIGSDYIWAWESNRVFREEFSRRGGRVLHESYIPIDGTDMDGCIEQILQLQPDFVCNSLIGHSSYHFFRKFRAVCEQRNIAQSTRFPVVSCNLSEADLMEIGPQASDGHLSSSVYFSSVETSENSIFVQKYCRNYPSDGLPTVEAEATYIATHLLAAALLSSTSDDVMTIRRAALQHHLWAPQGEVFLDPLTYHAYLTPRMGRSTAQGSFEIVAQALRPVRPDPYLVSSSTEWMLLPIEDSGVLQT